MKYDRRTYELVEAYLKGELNAEANEAFELLLAEDDKLASEVEAWMLANKAIEASASEALRMEIREGMRKHDHAYKLKWRIGGGLLLTGLLISGLLLVLKPAPETIENPDRLPEIKKETPRPEHKDTLSRPERANGEFTPRTGSIKRIDSSRFSAKVDLLPIQNPEDVIADPETGTINKDVIDSAVAISTEPEARSGAETSSIPIPTTDCSGLVFRLQPELKPACADRADGAIEFLQERIEGGAPPYRIRPAGSETASMYYPGLSSGDHAFIVSDRSGCMDTVNVYLPGKICGERSFVINPDAGESWETPVKDGDVFDIQIMDMGGNVVFAREQERKFAWTGISNQGFTLPSGLYVYLIMLEDKTSVSGQITIIR